MDIIYYVQSVYNINKELLEMIMNSLLVTVCYKLVYFNHDLLNDCLPVGGRFTPPLASQTPTQAGGLPTSDLSYGNTSPPTRDQQGNSFEI